MSGISKLDQSFFAEWAVLEEAALMLIGAPDEQQILNMYKGALLACLINNGVVASDAPALVDRLVDIICRRRIELEQAAGNNSGVRLQ